MNVKSSKFFYFILPVFFAVNLAGCFQMQTRVITSSAGSESTSSSTFGPVTPPSPVPSPSSSLSPLPILNASIKASVTFSADSNGAVLNSNFAGFSYEKNTVSKPLFSGDNAALIQLFKNLGPGILRIGGNSVDKTSWNASGLGLKAGEASPPDVARLAAFLQATGWKVIYGLNMGNSTPAVTASEAAYVSKSLKSSLYGFEIGNEPDLYFENGLRPTTYTYKDFSAEWLTFAKAILAQEPNVTLTGPASAGHVASYTVPFAADHGTNVSLLTQHYYRANGQNATSTIELLLAPDSNLPSQIQTLAAAAASQHISQGVRFAECNSFYNGGALGVSDGFGSALWAINYLFTLAQNGATGANFHGGGNGTGYTPIANNSTTGVVTDVRAEYYGIYLFSQAAQGRLMSVTSQPAISTFSSYGVLGQDGIVRAILVNTDPANSVRATLNWSGGLSSARALMLVGSGLLSTTDITLGGSSFAANGSWSPTQVYSVAVQNGISSVDVPPASAALIEVSH